MGNMVRRLPLWDQCSLRVLGWFTLAELRELEQEGLGAKRCRVCGRSDEAVKHNKPTMGADIEKWLCWLDERPATKHCVDHVLQLHATNLLRAQPTRGRVPRSVNDANLFVFYNPGIMPVLARPVLTDQVFDQLIKGL